MKLLTVVLCLLLLTAFLVPGLSAQTITPIHDVQFNAAEPGGPSPLSGTEVTVQGVVTISRGAFSSSYLFMQDMTGPWNGVQIYLGGSAYKDSTISEGDSIQVTGTVGEYNDQTQIGSVTDLVRLGTNKWIAPTVVTTNALATEDQYECVLVSVQDVTVTDDALDPGSYDYSFTVDDGSGAAEIGTRGDDNYFYQPMTNDVVGSITGVVLDYRGSYTLEPRAAYDFGAINDYTMIQSVQQVRYVEDVAGVDTSYFEGDTVLVKGIVTVPSGLFYAGSGVVIYMQDANSGPWSGVLAFADTPTGIDILYEGDEVQVKAVVTEYEHFDTGVAMTELRGVEAFQLLSEFNPLPEINVIGAIELDSTANGDVLSERLEGTLVQVQNARVDSTIRWSAGIRDYRLDDGSGGRVWGESRSDSLYGYEPPVGTLFETVTGVVYHRFGHYMILPRLPSDLVLITGPPIFSNVEFTPPVPTPDDSVTITASIQDDNQVTEAILHYQVNNGGFQTMPMTHAGGFEYSLNIGPFADQSMVDFYVMAKDDENNESTSPAGAPDSTFSFKVEIPQLDLKTIAQIREDADNDFVPDLKDTYVRVQGVITGNRFADYYTNAYMQDKTAGINLYVYGQYFAELELGDSVEVVGRVNQYNGLSEIQPDDTTKITILGKGSLPAPKELTCADLGETVGEMFEGSLVLIKNVTVTDGTWPAEGSNSSVTISDATGSATLYIDKDTDIDGSEQPPAAFNVIGLLGQYDSSTPYSSGYQLISRSQADISTATSVDENEGPLPLVFSLAQNYPNPFNPTTTINYSIAKNSHVKLSIYNVTGQKIRTLVDLDQRAGHQTISWDGTDLFGNLVASGIYIYRIHASDFVDVRKMLLIK